MLRREFIFVLAFFAATSVLHTPGLAQQISPANPDRNGFRLITLQVKESPLAKAPEDLISMLLSAISPDGQRVAYRSNMDDEVAVFVNNKAGNAYDAIQQGPVMSRAKPGHVAYVARRSGQTFVVVDGIESSPYDAVLENSLVFGPGGKRIAYAVERDGQWAAIVTEVQDGQFESAQYGQVYIGIAPAGFAFSPDGRRMAFAAQRDAVWVVVTDGKEGRHYEWVGHVGFHPDGKGLVYVVKKDGECFVVREDTQQKKLLAGPYEEVADVVFSPDGRWTAFWAKRDNQWRVVAAGTDGSRRSTRNAYDGYGEGTLAFSFDSKRLAFVGVREKQAVVVVKGVEYGPYDAILEGTPVFSPNSQRLAYGACQQGTWRVVVDGKERDATYGLIKEHSLQFTPDNQHVVYVASYGDTGKSMAIAVDGELSNDYLFPLGSKMVFNDPKSFQTVAVTGNLLPDSDGKNLRLENGQFVRVDVQIRTD